MQANADTHRMQPFGFGYPNFTYYTISKHSFSQNHKSHHLCRYKIILFPPNLLNFVFIICITHKLYVRQGSTIYIEMGIYIVYYRKFDRQSLHNRASKTLHTSPEVTCVAEVDLWQKVGVCFEEAGKVAKLTKDGSRLLTRSFCQSAQLPRCDDVTS